MLVSSYYMYLVISGGTTGATALQSYSRTILASFRSVRLIRTLATVMPQYDRPIVKTS